MMAFVLIMAVFGFIGLAGALWVDRPRKEKPAVRVSPEMLAQMRSELIHTASKRVVRSSFQRVGNGK